MLLDFAELLLRAPPFSLVVSSMSSGSSPSALISAAAASIVITLLFRSLVDARNDPLSSLPRPAYTLPILGNTIATLTTQRHRQYDWIADECELHRPKPWRMLIMGRGQSVVLASPELFEDVLKTHFDSFPKDESMCVNFRDLFGHGIFAVNGEEWYRHRHTASTLFSFQMLKHVMHEVVKEKVQVLSHVLVEHEAREKPVSLKTVLNHFTCDVFAKIGFGVERNALEGDLRGEPVDDFVEACATVSHATFFRFLVPRWFWQLLRHLDVLSEKRMRRSIRFFDALAYKIINKSILRRHRLRRASVLQQELDAPVGGGRDLISMFMESNTLTADTEDVDTKVIRDTVVSFIAAGTDTTCQSILTFIVMMNRYPQVLKKIRAELRLKLPSLQREGSEPPSMQDLSRLIYLEAVIQENLRLNPAIPITARVSSADVMLSDGTFIPKGTRVVLSFYASMRSKSVWGEDALEFKPERWINPSTGALVTVSPFKFPAFMAGPRVCLGKKLAKIELKMMLAVVLSRFDLTTLENPWEMTYQAGLTSSVKGPLMVNVTPAGAAAARRAASA
ncbi:Cytochrome p450 86a2 [Globisporangium polare]